jgi:hypothetical protein
MIAKHTLGSGFRGVLSYLLREGPAGVGRGPATIVGGNMSGRDARQLAREFGVYRRLNLAVSRPVFHASLRLPAGETLTDAQWRCAATIYLERMGYGATACVVIRHPERHIHIVASRVRFDGSTVASWHDRWRGLEAVAAVERRLGLSSPAVRPSGDGVTPARRCRARRAGTPPKVLLAERLDQAIARSDGGPEDFSRILSALGADVHWHLGRAGGVRGATFALVGDQEAGAAAGGRGQDDERAYGTRG